jgi:adenine-specific DNA-methyltransferase
MGKYDGLTQEELITLLEKRDRTKKLGLVWERDEIEADEAIDANFVAATLDPALSDKGSPWRNLVIEGDNFDALRWLRMTHAGQIKCIYVDPPYNTGSKDWVYNDHYFDKDDRFRFSTWLEFLYKRFTLARDLLTEDGVILVSINDENRAFMELMLDEALPGMRFGSLVWRTRDTTSAKAGNYSDVHEHVLIFGKNNFTLNGKKKSDSKYSNKDGDPRGAWNIDPLTLAFDRFQRENLYYPIFNPKTGRYYPCDPDRVWCYATEKKIKPGQHVRTETIEEFIRQDRIIFPNPETERVQIWSTIQELIEAINAGDIPRTPRKQLPLLRLDTPDLNFWVGKPVGFGRPGFKKFWNDLQSHVAPLSSWISRVSEEVNDEEIAVIRTTGGGEGTGEIQAIFGRKAFPNAKPPSLIRELVRQASSPGDLVLDFFAGSATTAQAVMELNAEGEGERRFIIVSSTEATEDDPDKNLCRDITSERIRRLNASDAPKYEALAAEFAYLKTRTIKFENLDVDLTPQEAWSAIEALHGLPLTEYRPGLPWNEHQEDGMTVIYADKVTDSLMSRMDILISQRANLFVYVWAPGQLDRFKGRDVEIRPIRSTLVKRFQQ